MRGSYCHCYHVMTFFSWSLTYSLGEVVNGNLLAPGAPLQLFALGPLISLGGPDHIIAALVAIRYSLPNNQLIYL